MSDLINSWSQRSSHKAIGQWAPGYLSTAGLLFWAEARRLTESARPYIYVIKVYGEDCGNQFPRASLHKEVRNWKALAHHSTERT